MRQTFKIYATRDEAVRAALRLCELDLRARVERDGLTVTYDAHTMERAVYPDGAGWVADAVRKAKALGI